MKYTQHFSTKITPQSQPIPGSTQVKNSAGGHAWKVDAWTQFNRFLILGSEGGSYYATEKALTVENAKASLEFIKSDGARAVARIVEVSDKGLAAKNDPAIFLLAMAAGAENPKTRSLALAALPKVCRTGTHLFHFADYVKAFRGFGRGLRRAFADWYNRPELATVALQAVKYQKRDGWSHRDILRLSHVKPLTNGHDALFNWIVNGELKCGKQATHPLASYIQDDGSEGLSIVRAFETAKTLKDDKLALMQLITDARLPRECIPTECLNSPAVWDALLQNMPLTALIRNLATMTKVGLLTPGSQAVKLVLERLGNRDYLHKSRVHPISVLAALKTYESGHGVRGSAQWTPVGKIVDALDEAFYATFDNVEPTGKRWVIGLDVSGSMSSATSQIAGIPGLDARTGSVALAMVTARTEQDYVITAFSTELQVLDISPRQRLDDIIRKTDPIPFGGTDCSQPILWASKTKTDADVFAIYTDSETFAGHIHASQALSQYRANRGIPDAAMVVVGMCANGFSIADPNDSRQLDVVGFSTDTPGVIASFAKGEF
jgi:60 kDa SS-A/Ro ribonucleoprotein